MQSNNSDIEGHEKEIMTDNIPQDNTNKRKESEKYQDLHNANNIAIDKLERILEDPVRQTKEIGASEKKLENQHVQVNVEVKAAEKTIISTPKNAEVEEVNSDEESLN